MNPDEYANLAAIEERHWYYAGKRLAVRYWLRRVGLARTDQVLLDCGAGTGRFATEISAHCQVLVLDDHEESLRILRTRFRPEQIITLAGDRIPLPDASIDFITALDVLEHVPNDKAVVGSFERLLRPGGCAIITVPASMALWSDWDVALHHFRRYDRLGLTKIFDTSQWQIEHVNYTNILVYPIVWLVRGWRRRFPVKLHDRMEDSLPPAPINAILKWIFVASAKVRFPFPFGVSLLLVARRR